MLKRIAHLGTVLFLITFCISLLLAAGNALTKDRISENDIQAAIVARQEALPEGKEFKEITPEIYEALSDGETVGWCVNSSSNGFGGKISLMVGIRTDGSISGVRILSFSETAGLGSKADSAWKDQYVGKREGVAVTKGTPADNEISAITGATVTSKAVTAGVNQAYEMLHEAGLLTEGGAN